MTAVPRLLLGRGIIRARHKPLSIVFSSNTNVGKTLLSGGLINAAHEKLASTHLVYYLKPIQTGFPVDSDARFVREITPSVAVENVYTFTDPVGPHVAAKREKRAVTDQMLVYETTKRIVHFDDLAKERGGVGTFGLIETAGGVNSPTMAG